MGGGERAPSWQVAKSHLTAPVAPILPQILAFSRYRMAILLKYEDDASLKIAKAGFYIRPEFFPL